MKKFLTPLFLSAFCLLALVQGTEIGEKFGV